MTTITEKIARDKGFGAFWDIAKAYGSIVVGLEGEVLLFNNGTSSPFPPNYGDGILHNVWCGGVKQGIENRAAKARAVLTEKANEAEEKVGRIEGEKARERELLRDCASLVQQHCSHITLADTLDRAFLIADLQIFRSPKRRPRRGIPTPHPVAPVRRVEG